MKKLTLGILSLIYLALAGGIVVNVHYCMGKVSETAYHYDANNTCNKCGMENKKGCCHSDFKVVKISDDQQLAKAGFTIAQLPIDIIVHSINLLQPDQGLEKIIASGYHPPPDKKASAIFLHNQVFRI